MRAHARTHSDRIIHSLNEQKFIHKTSGTHKIQIVREHLKFYNNFLF